ncbi:Ser/Thr protein phosphatase superfamily protein [Terfezia claveryi]|nr:Ser/Thr protein phosphatase superfamily protein [Terfezia claveryi]
MSYELFPIPKTSAPYLLLAGDIGNLSHYQQYLAFLRIQAEKFNHIYLVLGNHEFYHLPGGHAEGLALAAQLEKELNGKLTVLSRKRVDFVNEGVTVLGCTLWSRITERQKERISGAVSDFRGTIKGEWGVEEHNRECERDMEWLKSQLNGIEEEDKEGRGMMAERWGMGKDGSGKSKWKVLVATHHSPTYWKCSKPQHEGRDLSSAFCTELLFTGNINEGSEKIAVWAFGHTHFCTDYICPRKVRIVANQRGYWISSEDNRFDPGFVLEV